MPTDCPRTFQPGEKAAAESAPVPCGTKAPFGCNLFGNTLDTNLTELHFLRQRDDEGGQGAAPMPEVSGGRRGRGFAILATNLPVKRLTTKNIALRSPYSVFQGLG